MLGFVVLPVTFDELFVGLAPERRSLFIIGQEPTDLGERSDDDPASAANLTAQNPPIIPWLDGNHLPT